ncbi:MAG: BON domain-containing protein [Acidobacteriota bacterium]|nr:BON domain-containing protein [Acidobacteriota bacterium]
MIRGLFKLVVLAVIVVAAGVFFLGWDIDRFRGIERPRDVVSPSGEAAGRDVRAAARDAGTTAREKTSQAADATMRALEDGRLTTKIKAKMALDDSVKALDLNVDTKDTIVTLTGEVRSEAERQRALTLARETAGVTRVIDQLRVR